MKYWLFDGEDITGPFAPAEIAARADFSDQLLVCPETESEQDDAWKPVAFFNDFSAQALFEAVQGQKDPILDEPQPEPSPATPVQPEQPAPVQEVLSKEQITSVKISATDMDEPILPQDKTQAPAPEMQKPVNSAQLPLVGAPVHTDNLPTEMPAWHQEEPLQSAAQPEKIEKTDEPEELLQEQKIVSQTPAKTEEPATDLTQQPLREPATQALKAQETSPGQETPPVTSVQQPAQETQEPAFLIAEKKSFWVWLAALLALLILLITGGCWLMRKTVPQTPNKVAPLQDSVEVKSVPQEPEIVKPVATPPAPQTTALAPKPAPAATPNTPAAIPVPPPPKKENTAQQERALSIVKNYPLSNNRGTVENYFNRIYAAQLKQGYHSQWSAEPLHKNTYIVKYRLTKTRTEPIIYVFQADTATGKLTGALNNITLDLVGKI